jgi:ATP-binding cassette subfamily B protein
MSDSASPKFRSVLFTLARRQRLRYAWALFLWTSIWTMPVLIGLITATFFDALADGIERETLLAVVAATFAYAAGRSVAIMLGMRNHGSLIFRAGASMRRNLLERIYELPGANALDDTPGEVVSRFRDDVEHTLEPFDLSVDIVGATFAAIISFAILWSIDPLMTVVIALPVVVVGVVANRTGAALRRYRIRARETTEAITGFLGETFMATQSVKVAGAEANMLDRLGELNAVRRTMMVRDRTLTAVLEAAFRNTVNIGTGLILLMAAGRLNTAGDAGISIGEFTLFVFLLGIVTDAAYFSGVFFARAKQGTVSVERLTMTLRGAPWTRLFDETDLDLDAEPPPRIDDRGTPPPFQRFELSGLTYHYPGTTSGINEIDLTIDAGEFVVITGRIGAGKTTLLRTALGLLPADQGEIRWNGSVVDDPASQLGPPRIAYAPQVPRLFSMSLRENLVLGKSIDEEALDESIHIATMTHDVEMMPEGLETMIGPRGVRLSGGQVQRSASARMFTRESQILVLDDVSSALDVETEQMLWARLFASRANVATLVVSHRRAAMLRADKIVVMENGRIAATGTADELQKNSETFRAIWEGTSPTDGTTATRG